MPFDTIGRSQKRIRSSPLQFDEEDDFYSISFDDNLHSPFPINQDKDWLQENWIHGKNDKLSPTICSSDTTDNPSVYSLSLPTTDSTSFWKQPTISMPTTSELDIWSKFHLSYSDIGINMEANVTSASDLHSLIDAFSKLCSTDSSVVAHDPSSQSPPIPQSPISSGDDYISSNQSVTSASSGITLCRNKSHKLKPVNYFASVGRLGQLSHPHSKHGLISLKQVAEACIDTYFTCWVRNTPVLRRDEFMTWYEAQEDPTNTLIVNAICLFVFRHMVLHHSIPGVEHFVGDQDKIQEQEEYFFDTARECLSQSFDSPDRFTIVALLFMVFRAEPSRRHHYAGMAVSALHELDIYPRTIDESDDESYEKEMDTRLWWFVWAWDFYLYSSGSAKNTPQPRIPGSEIDFPKLLEQDIDGDETSVIAYIHCLRVWKIQAHLISTVYEQESDMTVEQLQEYDQQLLAFYAGLPDYLKFDSGFEYGHEDLFLACIRVNIEYNATRIILHKLFVPDQNDPRPSQFSLESLNICLKTALKQLSTLNSGSFLPNGRCTFDRDELWRASEVISIAMDVYRACASAEDCALIIKDIRPEEFENGLTRALEILKNTMEFEALNRNWIQVADWLQVEIRRHQLYSSPRFKSTDSKSKDANSSLNNTHPDYFLANLKADAETKRQAGMVDTNKIKSELLRRMSRSSLSQDTNSIANDKHRPVKNTYNNNSSWMQHQQVFSSYNIKDSSPTPPTSTIFKNNSMPISFMDQSYRFQNENSSKPFISKFSSIPASSTPMSFVQYQPQPSLNPPSEIKSNVTSIPKNQSKFRYFSPRKMNKFMFIDDTPVP
ncbi:hypothetical protein INT47_001944 [Mucor saturninus]|uniref:Transcription factor domain-containing protein n=1 Tax=Mucor saturninus TaxID=64648 RepID=A0A8H7V4G3_9FUNG|nr:hypothetical protein INT47_001944 [Mucor saturninus]